MRALKDRLERMESRVRDADRTFETSEQQMREAEQNSKNPGSGCAMPRCAPIRPWWKTKNWPTKAQHEKRAQESDRETQRLAFQDPLTGLPNINLISQYLEFTVKQCVRYRRAGGVAGYRHRSLQGFQRGHGL